MPMFLQANPQLPEPMYPASYSKLGLFPRAGHGQRTDTQTESPWGMQAKVMDQKACHHLRCLCDSCVSVWCQKQGYSLGENRLLTSRLFTEGFPHLHPKCNMPALPGKISQGALIAAMNGSGSPMAAGTGTALGGADGLDMDRTICQLDTAANKPNVVREKQLPLTHGFLSMLK